MIKQLLEIEQQQEQRAAARKAAEESGECPLKVFGFYGKHWIYASVVNGKKGDWKTAPASKLAFDWVMYDKWADPTMIVGCRFSWLCGYAVIDIDKDSLYHNINSLERIKACLSETGINKSILMQSSWSGGWHLYIPLGQLYKSERVAWAIASCLIERGLTIAPGQLELFPHVKNEDSLYNGHRLPLQPESGSFVLDDEGAIVHDSLKQFAAEWVETGAAQDRELLEIAINKSKKPRINNGQAQANGETIRYDLLESGWTDRGQSNSIVLAAASYCLEQHKLSNEEQLGAVTFELVQLLPGYKKFCGHQREMKSWCLRAARWALKGNRRRTISTSNTQYISGVKTLHTKASRQTAASVTHNQKRSEDSQARITAAVSANPYVEGSSKTEYMHLIAREAGCSIKTLTKHKKLWHPSHRHQPSPQTVEPQLVPQEVSAPAEAEVTSVSAEQIAEWHRIWDDALEQDRKANAERVARRRRSEIGDRLDAWADLLSSSANKSYISRISSMVRLYCKDTDIPHEMAYSGLYKEFARVHCQFVMADVDSSLLKAYEREGLDGKLYNLAVKLLRPDEEGNYEDYFLPGF